MFGGGGGGGGDAAAAAAAVDRASRYQTIVGAEGEKMFSCSDDFTLFLWKPAETKEPVGRMTGESVSPSVGQSGS